MTDAGPRTASLDAFRVIAITSVMLAHGSLLGIDQFPSLRYVTIIFGVVGVELFFVLSGFLIGRQLLNVGEDTQSIGNFWARRWLRTLPNYYLFLLVNLALYTYILKRPAGDLSLLVFSHNLVAPFTDAFFAESWSLAVEEWFYLLAPVLVLGCAASFTRQRKFAVVFTMLVMIIACTVARFWSAQFSSASIDSALRKIVLLRLDALALGVLLAWLERYRPSALARVSGAWWLGVLLMLVAISYLAALSEGLAFFAPPGIPHRLWAPLLFTLLPITCALLLAGAQATPMRARAWITNQSKWSYSMYLLHFPLLLLMLHCFGGLKNPVIIALAFFGWYVATVFGAAVTYFWFEKPMMDLRRRFAPLPKKGDRP